MRPAACAPMRTSPPDGSTRPGAEAAQPDLVAALVGSGVAVTCCRACCVVVVLPVVVMGGLLDLRLAAS